MTGVAVNVTEPPGQTGLSEALIVTLAGVFIFFSNRMGLDATGFGDAHPKLEVILQII